MTMEPPSKRLRTEDGFSQDRRIATPSILQKKPELKGEDLAEKEVRSGITEYVVPTADARFSGVLKQRYTDFLVNEVLPNGSVLHLREVRPRKKTVDVSQNGTNQEETRSEQPKPLADATGGKSKVQPHAAEAEKQQISPEDKDAMIKLFGVECTEKVTKLDQEIQEHPRRRPREFQSVRSESFSGKEARAEAHKTVRRIFNSRLETQTKDDGTIEFTCASRQTRSDVTPSSKSRGKMPWEDLGGEYIHFTLYKENRDTMETLSFLAMQMQLNVKRFRFGGTKDRKAVTVQRVSAYRVHADQLASVGERLSHAKIGDYEYQTYGLELGSLGGNEFCISLRDCHFPNETGMNLVQRKVFAEEKLSQAINIFRDHGFLNYYGLQRFGSFNSSTDMIGMKILQGDLEGAIDCILEYSPSLLSSAQDESSAPMSSDARHRADAIHLWKSTGKTHDALEKLPRRFSAEFNVIKHLGNKNRPQANDFQGALMTIPRTLMLMYVHAYQSLVWNIMVGERWKLYGSTVVEGDLVIDKDASSRNEAEPTIDEAGEPIVLPAAGDAAAEPDADYVRARPLSAEEADSTRWCIHDIVLPLPGFDVVYPPNRIGEMYKSFMASERGGGLDPYNMRRSWKVISLSGGYRHIMAKPTNLSFEIKTYTGDDEKLVETDLEKIEQSESIQSAYREDDRIAAANGEGKIAVILTMALGPSQYATMALRELMGAGGVKEYRADFSDGRNR